MVHFHKGDVAQKRDGMESPVLSACRGLVVWYLVAYERDHPRVRHISFFDLGSHYETLLDKHEEISRAYKFVM